jgi:NAD+ synthetase
VVFPELCLIGYPPDDLLLRSGLPAALRDAVQTLCRRIHGITAVIGLPEFDGEVLHNAAWVIRDGAVIARYRKALLPNYGVFDEKRHFASGRSDPPFEHHGRRIAVAVCEDLWSPGPTAAACAAGADLILSINASPFEAGKSGLRREVLAARVAESGVPILYVNLVGGQDDLVFDGGSFGLGADGALGCAAPSFEEGVYPVEWRDGALDGALAPEPAAVEQLWRALVRATRDYVERNGFPGALVGLSGGIDSALVAALAADALGGERVITVAMPSRYSADMSNEDAAAQAQRIGAQHLVLPIEPLIERFTETLAAPFAGRAPDLTEENLQSRTRGVLLMALSNKYGHVVLATGNKSEMATGYATLYGDMCGGFAPIKDVYKTRVFELARWRNAQPGGWVIPQRVIDRPPSAELRAEQKDSDSLPDYAVLDPILRAYVEESRSIADIIALGHDEAVVRRVAALVRRSEYKRRQAAPGPKVSARAFGRERRYPITAAYEDL